MNFGLLRSVEHPLMLKKLIEHRCEDGIADTSPYKLTEQAKRTLLAEMKINVTEEQLADGIRAEDLTAAKEMFDVEENQRYYRHEWRMCYWVEGLHLRAKVLIRQRDWVQALGMS